MRPEDVARLRFREPVDLASLKSEWLSALDDAERFVHSRPPAEAGCLYYSRDRNAFVADGVDADDVSPHYGRPGGVLPVLRD